MRYLPVILVLALSACHPQRPTRDLDVATDALATATAKAYATHLDYLPSLGLLTSVDPPTVTWEGVGFGPLRDELAAADRSARTMTPCFPETWVDVTYVGQDPAQVFDFAGSKLSDILSDQESGPSSSAYASEPVSNGVMIDRDDGSGFVHADRVYVIATLTCH